jgi:hypothetical protein
MRAGHAWIVDFEVIGVAPAQGIGARLEVDFPSLRRAGINYESAHRRALRFIGSGFYRIGRGLSPKKTVHALYSLKKAKKSTGCQPG